LASAQLADRQDDSRDGRAAAIMGDDHRHACDRQREGGKLIRLHPLATAQHRQGDGEKDLHLHHQGRQARRDHAVHGDEQKTELAQPDGNAIRHQVGERHVRAGQEEHHRHQHEGEAQRRKQERRQRVQPKPDDHEIGAPDQHHRQRQYQVAKGKRGTAHRNTFRLEPGI